MVEKRNNQLKIQIKFVDVTPETEGSKEIGSIWLKIETYPEKWFIKRFSYLDKEGISLVKYTYSPESCSIWKK